jgi:hypothetical protein
VSSEDDVSNDAQVHATSQPPPPPPNNNNNNNNNMTSRSKLGGEYTASEIQAMDKANHLELREMAKRCKCADCGSSTNNWSSCNLGVFLCIDCAQIHRGVGTHITKVKSCMGTYLWHPDEMERMRACAQKAGQLYGTGTMVKPDHEFVRRKYGASQGYPVAAVAAVATAGPTATSVERIPTALSHPSTQFYTAYGDSSMGFGSNGADQRKVESNGGGVWGWFSAKAGAIF